MARKRVLLISLAPVLLLVLAVGYMYAQGPEPQAGPGGNEGGIPQALLGSGFTYQGQLKDSEGNPIDDTCDFTFGLWDDASAGSQVGADSVVSGVAVTNGYFAALVNSGGEFGAGAFAGNERWLEIAVQCTADPAPVTLDPRQELTAAPYALSLRPGAIVEGEQAGAGLTVVNTATSGFGKGILGETFAPGTTNPFIMVSAGVHGVAKATSGPAYGVYGYSYSSEGAGVYGLSGTAFGVYGVSLSTAGRGVFGLASATSGTTYGVYGRSASTEGHGVYGWTDAITGTTSGVYGQSDSPQGRGVYGYNSASSGFASGVWGESDSTSGRGVYGRAHATSGFTYGVYGWSNSASGIGVFGAAWDSDADYGVYSWGNFAATGSKAAIVSTEDYGWRHLYAVESPDVLFEDVGTAQLVNGQAVVAINPIFAQTVNLEQPYQVFLTAVCEEPVLLFVSAQASRSFIVQGVTLSGQPTACSFHYRIIAKRLGYEDVRLAPAEDPALAAQEPALEVEP